MLTKWWPPNNERRTRNQLEEQSCQTIIGILGQTVNKLERFTQRKQLLWYYATKQIMRILTKNVSNLKTIFLGANRHCPTPKTQLLRRHNYGG